MKTGLQVAQDVRSLINLPVVTSAISGKIYPIKRSINSRLVDIVIGIQGLDNEQLQQGTVNVNVFVPNLISDSSMPDLATLDKLSALLSPLLDGQYRQEFHTKVGSPPIVYQDTDGSHFLNIKVDYYSIQTNFKNI